MLDGGVDVLELNGVVEELLGGALGGGAGKAGAICAAVSAGGAHGGGNVTRMNDVMRLRSKGRRRGGKTEGEVRGEGCEARGTCGREGTTVPWTENSLRRQPELRRVDDAGFRRWCFRRGIVRENDIAATTCAARGGGGSGFFRYLRVWGW